MNLEPLLMSYHGMEIEEYDGDPSNDDIANSNDSMEANDVAEENDVTKARGRMRWMDTQTRFLCRMLDDLYRTGIRRESDRPRTERCHRVSMNAVWHHMHFCILFA